MPDYKTPGVYVEETSVFPHSVHPLSTSKPVFVGFTERGPNQLTEIFSLLDFEQLFGAAYQELPDFTVDGNSVSTVTGEPVPETPEFYLYYSLQLYFANGGGPCYILPVGHFGDSYSVNDFKTTIRQLETHKGPSIIVLTDLNRFDDPHDYYSIYEEALDVSQKIGNCFTIIDTKHSVSNPGDHQVNIQELRNHLGGVNLRFGAAYYPLLVTYLRHTYSEDQVTVIKDGTHMVLRHSDQTINDNPTKKAESLYHNDGPRRANYRNIINKISNVRLVLPPSGAVAGIYAYTDLSRGVWKAPAGVALNNIERPLLNISSSEHEFMNISPDGKSVNAIRKFPNRGTQIWGARTLTGNDNEWRYISVRRFLSMIETSIQHAMEVFVFEPNDANTWQSVEAMIQNFLLNFWRKGGLQGSKPEHAFFVKVGLGSTMTQNDIQQGRMIIEIGMATVKPAEFIIIKIVQRMNS